MAMYIAVLANDPNKPPDAVNWININGKMAFPGNTISGVKSIRVLTPSGTWTSQATYHPPSTAPWTPAPDTFDAGSTTEAKGYVDTPNIGVTPNNERFDIEWMVNGVAAAQTRYNQQQKTRVTFTVNHMDEVRTRWRHVNNLGIGGWSDYGPGTIIFNHSMQK